jgi:hypothetical protein
MEKTASSAQRRRDDFRLKEFEMLRKEIEYRTGSQERTERNVFVGVLVVFAFLAAFTPDKLPHGLKNITNWFWMLPFVITILGIARFWDDHVAIHRIGDYIRTQEELISPKDGGWQTHRKKLRIRNSPSAWAFRLCGWGLLFFGTFAIGLYVIISN